jgi:16S rRNA processing protein RimM
MIAQQELYRIGMLNKPHGVKGELSFTFTDDIFDRAEADHLILKLDGIFVPFFIEEYRFRSDTTALIKLDGVDSEPQARRLTNTEVYFPLAQAQQEEAEPISWDYFIGFTVTELHAGGLGVITEIDASTLNILFVIDRNGEELLIPAQETFIVAIDKMTRNITLQLPEGLLD